MSKPIAVVGTGSWGTTLGRHLTNKGLPVFLLARTAEEAQTLRQERENKVFLPGMKLPDNLVITHRPEEALSGSQMVFLAVPAATMRENLTHLRDYGGQDTLWVSAAKGLERGTALRMSEVIAQEVPSATVAVLSGPTLAREIAVDLPSTAVVAAQEERVARLVQERLMTPNFRVYTNDDVIGVELGGALKNIIAIGVGICDGLGYGDNAKAALMTRGLAEITRLGVAAGARPLTFAGLAGLGDLVATCASPYSRNRYFGEQLAQGRSPEEIQAAMKMVAEGVPTTGEACRLAERYQVEMPISRAMYAVLFQGKNPRQAVTELMSREAKPELAGMDVYSSWVRGQ